MTVEQRIALCKLSLLISEYPEYSEKLGVEDNSYFKEDKEYEQK